MILCLGGAPAPGHAAAPATGEAPASPGTPATAPGAKVAYIVIATGAKTEDKAKRQLTQYKSKRYPSYGAFPKVMRSDSVPGLKPGLWIVAAAICTRKTVADALAEYIRKYNREAYVRAVEYAGADDLNLVQILPPQVIYGEDVVTSIQLEWEIGLAPDRRLKQTSLPDGSVMLPVVGPVPGVVRYVGVSIPLGHFNATLRGPGDCGYYDSRLTFEGGDSSNELVESPGGVFTVQVDRVELSEGACSD